MPLCLSSPLWAQEGHSSHRCAHPGTSYSPLCTSGYFLLTVTHREASIHPATHREASIHTVVHIQHPEVYTVVHIPHPEVYHGGDNPEVYHGGDNPGLSLKGVYIASQECI